MTKPVDPPARIRAAIAEVRNGRPAGPRPNLNKDRPNVDELHLSLMEDVAESMEAARGTEYAAEYSIHYVDGWETWKLAAAWAEKTLEKEEQPND